MILDNLGLFVLLLFVFFAGSVISLVFGILTYRLFKGLKRIVFKFLYYGGYVLMVVWLIILLINSPGAVLSSVISLFIYICIIRPAYRINRRIRLAK